MRLSQELELRQDDRSSATAAPTRVSAQEGHRPTAREVLKVWTELTADTAFPGSSLDDRANGVLRRAVERRIFSSNARPGNYFSLVDHYSAPTSSNRFRKRRSLNSKQLGWIPWLDEDLR